MIEEYRNGKELEEKAKEAGFTSYMDMATHVHAIGGESAGQIGWGEVNMPLNTLVAAYTRYPE